MGETTMYCMICGGQAPCPTHTLEESLSLRAHGYRCPDSEWAAMMVRIRSIRGALSFSRRVKFDDELRPILNSGARIAYPDAIYHIDKADLERALGAVERD